MRGYEFLDKMKLIDSAFVEEADQEPQKRKNAQKIKAIISKMLAKFLQKCCIFVL